MKRKMNCIKCETCGTWYAETYAVCHYCLLGEAEQEARDKTRWAEICEQDVTDSTNDELKALEKIKELELDKERMFDKYLLLKTEIKAYRKSIAIISGYGNDYPNTSPIEAEKEE